MVTKPIAILPARGGSKRIPRKNIADLHGRPLISFPITACTASGLFAQTIVSTEDHEIAAVAEAHGAEADERPVELAGDRVPATLACKELLLRRFTDATRPEWFCLVYPIAVFLRPEDLAASSEKRAGADAVLGVTGYPIHPYKALVERNGFAVPLWPEQNQLQSQHFPQVFASNGTFCWVRTEPFLENPSLYPPNLRIHPMPLDRSVDIDTPEDLEQARRLMRALSREDDQTPD